MVVAVAAVAAMPQIYFNFWFFSYRSTIVRSELRQKSEKQKNNTIRLPMVLQKYYQKANERKSNTGLQFKPRRECKGFYFEKNEKKAITYKINKIVHTES